MVGRQLAMFGVHARLRPVDHDLQRPGLLTHDATAPVDRFCQTVEVLHGVQLQLAVKADRPNHWERQSGFLDPACR
ncbi:MAG: hypothetical protein M3252_02300 [Actinomycetota bacterium]|nr:hypothetical protein [Actinomycetota bacterium]